MTVLGDNSKPGNSYFAYDGSGYPNQVAEKLTAPGHIKLITLGAWVGGWSGTAHCVLAVWDAAFHLLGTSAEFIAANEGAAANGNVSQYQQDLTTPVAIAAGADFWVGVMRNRSDAAQWSTGTTTNGHDEATGAYPAGDLGAISGPSSVARRVGMYVANYQPVSAAWIYRSGAWVQSSAFQVYRSGAWVDVDTVEVLRSGTWVDAS